MDLFTIIYLNNNKKNKKKSIKVGLCNKWTNNKKCKDLFLKKLKKFIKNYNIKKYNRSSSFWIKLK
jgi:hypothetical protein